MKLSKKTLVMIILNLIILPLLGNESLNNYLGINEEYDSVNESMYFNNLEDIKNYCDEIICYYSDNDPYVKYNVEKEFADTVATEQYCIHNGGHLNAESNYIEFRELLNHK